VRPPLVELTEDEKSKVWSQMEALEAAENV
jgi:hypothetical protein